MLDRTMLYDIVYALAARDGREAALFGDCAPSAHEAFSRSCAGPTFPEVWFELPLAGDPWFDLHVLTSREALEPNMRFSPDETGGYPELFEWFASAPDVRQLALSYDVHTAGIERPAVQLLAGKAQQHVPFLELAGGEAAATAYRLFAQRLPRDWFACYTGIFPGRTGSAVRVECIPNIDLQRAYASDEALLEAHLRQVGFSAIGDTLASRCRLLAQMPFCIEFQFDILPDGVPADTIGVSLRFCAPPGTDEWQPFDVHGTAGSLMEQVERWGLADARWRLLADTVFAKRIAHEGKSALAAFYPAFVKLRWRAGEPLDAKTYLVAAIE